MAGWVVRVVRQVSGLLCVGLLVTGCIDGEFEPAGESELVLLGHAPQAGEACEAQVAPFVRPTVDLVVADTYEYLLAFENRSSVAMTISSVELQWVTSANLTFSLPSGRLDSFPVGGVVGPDSTAVLEMPALRPEDIEMLRQAPEFRVFGEDGAPVERHSGTQMQVGLSVQVRATTPAGRTVKVPPVTLTLELCVGCLIEYVPSTLVRGEFGDWTCDEELLVGEVLQPVATSCRPGQDSMVDCRVCRTLQSQWAHLCDPDNGR